MTRVLIVGGSGMLGSAVSRALEERGAEPRPVSRRTGVDVTTGAGLDAALEGVEVVVDATNGPPNRRARRVLVDGTRRLLEAEARAGVRHHVGVSIVGCDRVPMAYYRVKVEQERVIEAGPVAWTIVRATQFHELVRRWATGLARPFAGVRLQPAAVEEVAAVVADVALGAPRHGRISVAGPEVHEMSELVRLLGARTLLLPVPGALGRAVRDGALTDDHPDVRTAQTFRQWLTT